MLRNVMFNFVPDKYQMWVDKVQTWFSMEFSDIEEILNETNKVLQDKDDSSNLDYFGFLFEEVFLVSSRMTADNYLFCSKQLLYRFVS